MCGRAVEVELPSNGDEKPSPFNCEGPPRDSLLLCQSLSCSVSMCTICLSAWATAEWQVPSENMAHNVNARQARGLRKDCSCPSLFPTSSVTAKADVTALSSLKNLFADISSFCHTAEKLTDWLNDWGGKYAECQADSHLMDRCGGEHSIISFFFNFTTLCRNGKLLLFSSVVFDRGVTTGGLQMTFFFFFFTIALRICSVLPFWMHVYSSSMCGCQVNTSLGDRTLWPF